ncbi:hypothetical protein LFYK43_17280 [Ligilactobacillus salitolerans]|uniref:LXG domain-containing protein n=1 Tax=Ligilactobacillus salitolerans TaxID=1808352 RepID=A0A401IUR5_9LACO|nr:T7SS effector LXG polymorphic toxin [Ligilactobacillus salitolerans]GBG95269.1 hypothetical protein LFYK43_17280 [Ligilactobacillus salitolerans]
MSEIDYEKLVDYQQSMHKGIVRRKEKLQATQKALDAIANSLNFTGKTADNIKSYIDEVHTSGIIQQLLTALDTFDRVITAYVANYPRVDAGGKLFKLYDEDFDKHQQELKTARGKYAEIISSANKAMSSVSHIKETSGHSSLKKAGSDLKETLGKMEKIAENQQNDWHSYESGHADDFGDVQSVVDKVNSLVGQYSGGKMPVMGDYVAGGFNAAMGQQYTNVLQGMQQKNTQEAKQTAANNQKIVAANQEQYLFEKNKKLKQLEKKS